MTRIPRLDRIIRAAAVALAMLLPVPAPAPAQSSDAQVFAVIDIQKVLQESKAAEGIHPQMEDLRKSYEDEVRRQERSLREADEELQRQRAILAPEAFADRRQSFEERATQAQRDVNARKRQLDAIFGNAMGKVQQQMLEIIAEVAERRNLMLVLPKDTVVLVDRRLDISEEVLKLLDERLPSVAVETRPPRGQPGATPRQ